MGLLEKQQVFEYLMPKYDSNIDNQLECVSRLIQQIDVCVSYVDHSMGD